MKKEHIPYYISILSLIVSGIAIGVSCYRTEELNADYMGVIVGILSLLVVFTVGWQILNYTQIKEETVKLVKTEIVNTTENYKYVLSGVSMFNSSNSLITGDCEVLIDNSFNALSEVLKCRDENLNETIINYIMDFIYVVFKEMGKEDKINIYDKKPDYLFLIQTINHKYKDEICRFIDNANVVPIKENTLKFMSEMGDDEFNEICT